jgi:hypothetical protein
MDQGRETATVRQAILILVLVAASFLGGAFVNGPGLHWAQARLLRSLDLSNGGEITSVDLKATVSTETTEDGSVPAKAAVSTTRSPFAVVSSILAEDGCSEHDAPNHRPSSDLRLKSKHGKLGPAQSQPLVISTPPLIKLSPALTKNPAGESSPLDPQVTPTRVVSSLASALSDPQVTPAILDSLATVRTPPTPPVSGSPSLSLARSPSVPQLIGDSRDEWTVLERKMQTLGVSRFGIDAELGGQVVFSCLIPLAGRQAVAQRFEAEADDMIQAAQAALRRVRLWRATQAPSTK